MMYSAHVIALFMGCPRLDGLWVSCQATFKRPTKLNFGLTEKCLDLDSSAQCHYSLIVRVLGSSLLVYFSIFWLFWRQFCKCFK